MGNLRENPEIKKLPEAIQTKLFNFIEKEIPKTKFFKPDGKPKKEWIIFYGETWDAARDAARDAAWDAARDAARDAAFQTYFILTEDLDYKDKEKHTKYAKDLWEIYKKGYGCICDVNGVFYVYAVDKSKKEKHKHVFKCECGKVKK